MPRTLQPIAVLFARLGVLLLIYMVLRLAFLVINAGHFPDAPFSAFLGGVRFDLWSIVWINLPYAILFLIWPRPLGATRRFLKWLFIITNGIGILLNCIDLAYFDFTLKRSTADLFGIATAGNELVHLLPSFLIDYWYVPILLVLLIWGMRWHYDKAGRYDKGQPGTVQGRVLWSFALILFWMILMRGGVQYKPITPLHAGNYAPPAYYPLVLNTPFTVMQSLGKPVLRPVEYMTQQGADETWPVIHRSNRTSMIGDRPNVVVIIMESFAAEYSGVLSSGTTYMPFLDSLMLNSMNFTKAYANGRRSIDALPAIVSSIPMLMDEALITSPYANVPMTSLPNVLSEEGYSTSFFHGGHEGTMGFDVFTKAAGVDRYVGMKEYPNKDDYDGSWGIYDGPFLQFFAEEMDKEWQPFCSMFFSLSSHHPYSIPEEFGARFDGGELRIHPTIRYADDALRKFFATASTMDWFDNTLFVITADHTAQTTSTANFREIQDHHIPMVYYMPMQLQAEQRKTVTQQMDMLPTVLDLMGHGAPYFSFGQSAIGAGPHIALTARSGIYQAISNDRLLQFDGEEVIRFSDHKGGSVTNTPAKTALANELKAAIQQFNTNLLKGDLKVKE